MLAHPQLIEEVQSYKKKIRQLEDDLLFRLSNSQGNLLDDTELIDVLAVTKQTAQVCLRWLRTSPCTWSKPLWVAAALCFCVCMA